MKSVFQWFHDQQIERTIKALEKNQIPAFFIPNKKEAKEKILDMIPQGSSIGIGGSVSMEQLGLIEEIKRREFTLFNPFDPSLSEDKNIVMRRKALLSDVFLTSTNAVTEQGQLFNIDATGNRVSAMIFGPSKVIVIAGFNKIVRNMDEAIIKVKERTAPINAKRLKKNTPCVYSGKCEDCESPERICNIGVIIYKKPKLTDLNVFLIGKNLGI
jgi:L-lactate utilization protein LutB